MKEGKIKLPFLDGFKALTHSGFVSFYDSDDNISYIGTCKLDMDDKGHFGELNLTKEVNIDDYLYYKHINRNDGHFHLQSFHLSKVILSDSHELVSSIPPEQLKQLIL